MECEKIAILCNPFAGSGKDRVDLLTRQVFECLKPQVKQILVGPSYMGADICTGSDVSVIGQVKTQSRQDTIEVTRQMVHSGADLFIIIAGDGTYNDALEGMKQAGKTIPIFGIAAGRFNTLHPKRKHDPFVSWRGDFRPFSIGNLIVEDVPGLLSRINGETTSYGFFWAVISNLLPYSDQQGNFITIDAGKAMKGEIIRSQGASPVATEQTTITLKSATLGDIVLAQGPDISMPVVAHIVPEINQIMAACFGWMAEAMGFHGVAYYFTDPNIPFRPSKEFFPITERSLAFYEGDQVVFAELANEAVFQVDGTPLRILSSDDILSIEVVLKLGKKAVLQHR